LQTAATVFWFDPGGRQITALVADWRALADCFGAETNFFLRYIWLCWRFYLLSFLRSHQGPKATFMVANGLAEIFGWHRKRSQRHEANSLNKAISAQSAKQGEDTPRSSAGVTLPDYPHP
jgi:hypothetical protein